MSMEGDQKIYFLGAAAIQDPHYFPPFKYKLFSQC